MSRESVEERISAYLDGELSAAEKAEVERALATDPSLRHLHDELARMRQLLQALPRATPAGSLRNSVRKAIGDSVSCGQPVEPATRPSANRRRPRRFWRWGAAITVAAAAALLLVLPWVQNAIEPEGHASREAIEGTRPDRLRETEDVAVPFAADLEKASAEESASAGMAGMGDDSTDDGAVAGGGGGGFGLRAGMGPGGVEGSLADKSGVAEGLVRPSHALTGDPASLDRLLDTLSREGTIELVGTMPVEVAARMKQSSGRRSMAEVPQPQSRPLAMRAAVDERKKSTHLSESKNKVAGEAAQPAKPAAPMTRARNEPMAILGQGQTEASGSQTPVMVVRGTRQEIASQLKWLLRQPNVELSVIASRPQPATASATEQRAMKRKSAPADRPQPSAAQRAEPGIDLGHHGGKAKTERALKEQAEKQAEQPMAMRLETYDKKRDEQQPVWPAESENLQRRRLRLRIRLELVAEKGEKLPTATGKKP